MYINFFLSILFSCIFSSEVYVTLQMLDKVAIVDSYSNLVIESIEIDISSSNIDNCMDYDTEMNCNMADGCNWMGGMCMEDSSGMMMGNHTPHFIVIDEINKYWFITTITSGYVIRYDLETNEMIDYVYVGDSPALMTLNKIDMKLYCSRMMPMGNMMPGSTSTFVQEIDYSGQMMMSMQEFEIPSPAPHGISINSLGTEVYVASNTSDWIYKIVVNSGEIFGAVMDLSINNPQNLATQRLKPIQCLSVADSLLFVTCSGGKWTDPWTGDIDEINGRIQLWNTNAMELVDEFEYNWYSTPWHVIDSPNSRHVYIVLAGDQLYEQSSGVSKVAYSNEGFINEEWYSSNDIYDTLHGIDISIDGSEVYVSGRGDGYLHTIQSNNGDLLYSTPLSNNLSMVMSGGVATNYGSYVTQGDINFDGNVDITDLVHLINFVLNNSIINDVAQYNCDFNYDMSLNILDTVQMVQYILNN